MKKETKKLLLVLVIAVVVMFLIGYLPAETEQMTRTAWLYLGCFAFLLICMISRILPDWIIGLTTLCFMLIFKVGKLSALTAQFSGSTVWMCIGVFIMAIGIANSGFMKRLALWIITKFPGTYKGQVAAMLVSGLVFTPILPSTNAKCSIMAPLINQVCKIVGVEPCSRSARGLWFANFMCTWFLSIAFFTGSSFVPLMIGFMGGLTFTWTSWFKCTVVWFVVLIILTYIYCAFLCQPKEPLSGDTESLRKQYQELGPVTDKERKGMIICGAAIILWLTQSLHGIDAGFVAIMADIAFYCVGLITANEVNAKGQWTLILFIGSILGIASFMTSTGAGDWISSIVGPILSPIMVNPYVFVICLCLITFVGRYFIVNRSGMLAMMIAIFGPLMEAHGMSMFILVFVHYMAGATWNMPYTTPLVMGFLKITGEDCIDFDCAKKASYAYMVMTLIAMTASVPLWHALGMC